MVRSQCRTENGHGSFPRTNQTKFRDFTHGRIVFCAFIPRGLFLEKLADSISQRNAKWLQKIQAGIRTFAHGASPSGWDATEPSTAAFAASKSAKSPRYRNPFFCRFRCVASYACQLSVFVACPRCRSPSWNAQRYGEIHQVRSPSAVSVRSSISMVVRR